MDAIEEWPAAQARAVTSRRTVDQLRGWAIAGDVEPYLPHFAVLGDLPDEALPEEPLRRC